MFRMRNVVAVLLVISAICGGLIGCAPPVEEVVPPAELKPCTVELSGVYHRVGGGMPAFGTGSGDMIVKVVEFTISNPNDYMVGVDGFTYELDVGEEFVAPDQIAYKYFIPAGEKITLQGAACFQWVALYQAKCDEALVGAEAVEATAPLWKGLGGPRIDIMYWPYSSNVPYFGSQMKVDAATWAAVEAKKVVYKWEGRLHTSGEGMDKYTSYSGSL